MYRKLIHESEYFWIDWLVVRMVGLRSSSPIVGTAVHYGSPATNTSKLIVHDGWGLSSVNLSLKNLDPLGQR